MAPFVKHCEAERSRLQVDLGDRGLLSGVASTSSRSHPRDGAEALAQQVARLGLPGRLPPDPFLFQPGQGISSDGLRGEIGGLA